LDQGQRSQVKKLKKYRKQIMKIKATYTSKSDCLKLHYDKNARKAIRKTASRFASIFDATEWDLDALAIDPQQNFELRHGIHLLAQIGSSKSTRFLTTGHEAGLALNAACWSTLYLLHKGKPVNHARPVLRLLARVAPLAILSSPLPPSTEVLSKEALSDGLGGAYELIRAAGPNGIAQVPTLQAIQLGDELRRLPKRSKNIKSLIEFLEISFMFYQSTLEALDRAKLASGEKKGARK
jgi:hypothetical protein